MRPSTVAELCSAGGVVQAASSLAACSLITAVSPRPAGIQPLPESYAAVVAGYVARGDLDMAAAVLASNRRSGVDATLSWLALTAAMFRAGREERAMALLEQVRGSKGRPAGGRGAVAQF